MSAAQPARDLMAANDLLDGKVVLVTGAGGGVGRGIALACARAGAHVVVTARSASGDETSALIAERGGSAISVRCDVTARAEVDRAVAEAVEAFGGLDAMIHNATSRESSQAHDLEDASLELWDAHAAVSVRGSVHCAQAAHAELAARGGTLILLSSPAGIEGSDTLPFYGMVKGAQRAIVKSLAQEWGPDGIRVNAIAPLAGSDALDRRLAEDPSLQAKLEAIVPLRRIGEAEDDIGYVAAFLASDWSGYITGQTLLVNGGRLTLL